MATTSSERRLHPVSVLLNVGKRLPQFGLPIVLTVFTTRSFDLLLPIVGGIVLLVTIPTVIGYFRFTYEYGETELVVRSGLFTRNVRIIPYARIQNLDATQSLVQRMLGVTAVQVQTGGGVLPEATLSVLPLPALDELRARVLGGASAPHAAVVAEESTAPAEGAAQRTVLLQLSPRELMLAGFIENRGFVLIFGAFALLEQTGMVQRSIEWVAAQDSAFMRAVAQEWLNRTELPIGRALAIVAAMVLVLLLFVRVLSTIWGLIRLFDFQLSLVGSDLSLQYGMFTRISATIPLRRIQTVTVQETLLHRRLARLSISVVTAGGQATDESGTPRAPVAPILPRARVDELLHVLQPGLTLDAFDWQPVDPRAFGRILRGALPWPVLTGGAALFIVPPGAAAVLFAVLTALTICNARLRARTLAWTLTADAVGARDGALTRTIRVARYNRVQAISMHRNPFDLRLGMARVRADTAGLRGGVAVPFLGHDTADELHARLVERTEATPFTW